MDLGYHSLKQNSTLDKFKEEQNSISKQYKQYDIRQDPRFGEIILYKNKMGIIFCSLVKKIPFHKNKEYQMFNRFCKIRKELDHKYLLPLMHYYAVENEDYTIKYWKFYFMFEYSNNDLKLELKFRRIHNKRFTILELWKIAKGKLRLTEAVITGFYYMFENSYSFDFDLHPFNILLFKRGKKFKVRKTFEK